MYHIPEKFNDAILNYRNRDGELVELAPLIEKHAPKLKEIKDKDDRQYMTAKLAYVMRCIEAAHSMGYTELSLDNAHWDNDGQTIIEGPVHGEEEGRELAQKHGLTWQMPNHMSDVLATRRQGDAIIALMGTDNTHAYWDGGTVWVVAAYAPYSPDPCKGGRSVLSLYQNYP